ncbi:MAG: hypothetical protein U0228_29570 [Myxococcaceae bacterium]
MPAKVLRCGARLVSIDESICEMARPRVNWPAFEVAEPGSEALALTVTRREAIEGGLRLDAPLGQCTMRRQGAALEVQLEDGMFRGELVLRLAWYLAGTDDGAVLIHANALSNGARASVAAGKSGDGKSTLARLGAEAGLTLLSDEVVMLFPDGRVSGTPFKSDFDRPGSPGLVRAKYFLALHKAPHEALGPLSAMDAAQLAMGQCFEVAELALPRSEVRRRLLAFLSSVELATLSFRKDVAAGEFVKQALASE